MFNGIREIVTLPSGGEGPGSMACDILFKLHQGTHSPDAFRNNSHERFLNYRCPNGLEVFFKSLQPFGVANSFTDYGVDTEFNRRTTSGASPAPCATQTQLGCQPAGAERRVIPTVAMMIGAYQQFHNTTDGTGSNPPCENCAATEALASEMAAIGVPAPGYYLPHWNGESWQGGPQILQFPAGTRFQFAAGPYWNVKNPSRYFNLNATSDPASPVYRLGRQIDLCFSPGFLAYGSFDCRLARLRGDASTVSFDSPQSPFTGTVRNNETNFVVLMNPDPARRRVFYNAYGLNDLDGTDGVNPQGELPLKRSAKFPIRAKFSTTPVEGYNIKLANFGGRTQCGGSSCWTDFGLYRLPDGTWIDAIVRAPN